jgi:hypothetical protein
MATEEELRTENAALKAKIANLEWHYAGCATQRHEAELKVIQVRDAVELLRRLLEEKTDVILRLKTQVVVRQAVIERVVVLLREVGDTDRTAWAAPTLAVIEVILEILQKFDETVG